MDIAATPGRAIKVDDMGHFGAQVNWKHRVDNGAIEGLTPDEYRALDAVVHKGQLPDHAVGDDGKLAQLYGPRERFGRQMRRALLNLGIDRVQYKNGVEDPGTMSWAFLDPTRLRWRSKAKFDPNHEGKSGLLLSAGGLATSGALGALAREREKHTRSAA
jgi:hypothetical protein